MENNVRIMKGPSPFRYHVEVYLTDSLQYVPFAGIKRSSQGIYVRLFSDDRRQHMTYHRDGKRHFRILVWERNKKGTLVPVVKTADQGKGPPLDKLNDAIQIGDYCVVRDLSQLQSVSQSASFKPDPKAHHLVFNVNLFSGQLFHMDPFICPQEDFNALRKALSFAQYHKGLIYLYTLGSPWLALIFFSTPRPK